MRKNHICILSSIAILILLNINIQSIPGLQHQPLLQTIQSTEYFSPPIIHQNDEYSTITLAESNSVLTQDNKPMLPVVVKTFEFPVGTKILGIEGIPSNGKMISIQKKIQPGPIKQKIDSKIILLQESGDQETYASQKFYPEAWYHYTVGRGLNKKNDPTVFVSIHIYPIRYCAAENLITTIQSIQLIITYEQHPVGILSKESYDLLIIAPAEFSAHLQPLLTHKNSYTMRTILQNLEDIYTNFPGRDNAEQIKYCVKYAYDTWNIQYVLLVGDMKKLPIRHTYASWWEPDILSDLYYADIYDEHDIFCSWDGNNNNKFGETNHDNDIDGVDLYPDVHIGRLACSNIQEVDTVVNKIITYETTTYHQSWFNTVIVAGGDTFPPGCGAPPNVFEGEITNAKVLEQLPSFSPVKLWSSTKNLNAQMFNKAINQGAGFLSYAGHGFEHGWGTYRPNSLRYKMGFSQPLYYTPFIKKLYNQNQLPVMFFDACLTAKLDFNVSDLMRYYPVFTNLLIALSQIENNPSIFYPCFAWSFVAYENGGAIATIGATRTAYTHVDSNGVYAGAGYLDVHFFQGYEEGVHLGQMLTRSQNDYINYVGPDYFTIEEFILLGDPSLKIGGYP
ncbi:MAG: C25 family cysteine peptidase [Candidatus Thermoplasmatota archaeon]